MQFRGNEMKLFLYYTVSLIINCIIIFIFKGNINIDTASASPVFLMILSAFMAVYYYTNRSKEDLGTNYYGIEFTEEEWESISLYTCRFSASVIPLYVPFIFFFPSLI